MSTDLQKQELKKENAVVEYGGKKGDTLDTQKWENMWRIAEGLSRGTLIPEAYQKNASNCFLALNTAVSLGINPMLFFQKSYVINSKITLEAQLAIAIANSSGVFDGPIKYELSGDAKNRSCTARATLRESGEIIESTVDMDTVRKFGWDTKKNSMWAMGPAMCDQMLRYRAAAWMIRAYVPEVLCGLYFNDEMQDDTPQVGMRIKQVTREEVLGLRVEPPRETSESTGIVDSSYIESTPKETDITPSLIDFVKSKIRGATTEAAVVSIADRAMSEKDLSDEDKMEIEAFASDRIAMIKEESNA